MKALRIIVGSSLFLGAMCYGVYYTIATVGIINLLKITGVGVCVCLVEFIALVIMFAGGKKK